MEHKLKALTQRQDRKADSYSAFSFAGTRAAPLLLLTVTIDGRGKLHFKGACITSRYVVSSKILKYFLEVSAVCHVKYYLKRVKTKPWFYLNSINCG